MARLLHDRYVICGRDRVCDLVTGEEATFADVKAVDADGEDERPLAALVELFEHGRDGNPRWVVANARNGSHVASLRRRAAAAARRRGYVPVSLSMFERWRPMLEEDLRDRAVLVLADTVERASASQALLWIAALSARPHILLTFGIAAGGAVPVVREARAAYGAPVRDRARLSVLTGEAVRQLARAERATAFARAGRHAAAERLLRDVAASLERRGAHEPAAQVTITLAGMVLERGRTVDGMALGREAVRLADAASAVALGVEGRSMLAWATMDAGRLPEAESLLRAVLLTSPEHAAWPAVGLVRCLLAQGRVRDARETADRHGANEHQGWHAAVAGALHVRLSLLEGDLFAAGQRARDALDKADAGDDPLARVVTSTARLRVLCAAGDLADASVALERVLELARAGHMPLRAIRARMVWVEALRRAARTAEARREVKSLQRLAPMCSPLLRRLIAALATDPVDSPRVLVTVTETTVSPGDLVRSAQEVEDDRDAMRGALQRVLADLAASRAELVATDRDVCTSVAAAGAGPGVTVGTRVIESGIPLGFDDGSEQAGVPVRLGTQLLGAVACRWPVDRRAPARSQTVLELVAAVLAPRLESLLWRSRAEARASTAVPELVGASSAIEDVRRAIARAARAPFAVLIEGESGTGKELVARAIHQLGPRRERRFCDVNCAALPDDLFESELFGHARGAFTGAVAERPGLFEEASGGTLFLDEVAELSPRAQAKLLRAVQQQEIRRVGESFSRSVDVRIIAAANREMQREAADGRFRQDLLYRLNVIRIRMPPLRERLSDIPQLARHFWETATSRVGSTAVLTPAAVAGLARYHWPGNVRELQNVIAALAVAAPSRGRVSATLLPPIMGTAAAATSVRLADARLQFDRRFVEAALARAAGSRTRAAAALGVSRQGLLKLMARLQLAGDSTSG